MHTSKIFSLIWKFNWENAHDVDKRYIDGIKIKLWLGGDTDSEILHIINNKQIKQWNKLKNNNCKDSSEIIIVLDNIIDSITDKYCESSTSKAVVKAVKNELLQKLKENEII